MEFCTGNITVDGFSNSSAFDHLADDRLLHVVSAVSPFGKSTLSTQQHRAVFGALIRVICCGQRLSVNFSVDSGLKRKEQYRFGWPLLDLDSVLRTSLHHVGAHVPVPQRGTGK